jgi:iron complex transport system ATP-binding protein
MSELDPSLPSGAAALDADALTVTLGGRVVLDRVSLQLQAGGWSAIVGPNGAGKSTLLAALAGLRRPQSGTVRLQGRTIADWPVRERARRLAWMSQHGEADGDLSARDAVLLGRLPHHGLFGSPDAHDTAIADAAMRETECATFAARRLGALSGGERQRVLLARAFAVGAPVLLLDEPTTHLDAPHQRMLGRSLRARAREGVAVATVLHDLNLALAADRLLVMESGRLRADGPPSDPGVRGMLEHVFGQAIRIERIARDIGRADGDAAVGGVERTGHDDRDADRWIAVPLD